MLPSLPSNIFLLEKPLIKYQYLKFSMMIIFKTSAQSTSHMTTLLHQHMYVHPVGTRSFIFTWTACTRHTSILCCSFFFFNAYNRKVSCVNIQIKIWTNTKNCSPTFVSCIPVFKHKGLSFSQNEDIYLIYHLCQYFHIKFCSINCKKIQKEILEKT